MLLHTAPGHRVASSHDVNALPDRLTRVMDEPVVSWRRLETTPLNAAYYLRLADKREQVLWISQRDAEPRVERYVAAITLLPYLTPPLVRADTTRTRLDYPYLITVYRPEPTLEAAWPHLHASQRAQAAYTWGRALRLIHRIRFSLAGDLALPETCGRRLPEELRASWQRLLASSEAHTMAGTKGGALDRAALAALFAQAEGLLADAPITLCHGSATRKNMLWSPAQANVVAAIDFKRARRSDPLTDLAALWDEVTALGCEASFLKGYGPLSRWELTRLAVHKTHHALACYVDATCSDPRRVGGWRQRLAEATLELQRRLSQYPQYRASPRVTARATSRATSLS